MELLRPAEIDAQRLLAAALAPRMARWLTCCVVVMLVQAIGVAALCIAALLQPVEVIAVSASGKVFTLKPIEAPR